MSSVNFTPVPFRTPNLSTQQTPDTEKNLDAEGGPSAWTSEQQYQFQTAKKTTKRISPAPKTNNIQSGKKNKRYSINSSTLTGSPFTEDLNESQSEDDDITESFQNLNNVAAESDPETKKQKYQRLDNDNISLNQFYQEQLYVDYTNHVASEITDNKTDSNQIQFDQQQIQFLTDCDLQGTMNHDSIYNDEFYNNIDQGQQVTVQSRFNDNTARQLSDSMSSSELCNIGIASSAPQSAPCSGRGLGSAPCSGRGQENKHINNPNRQYDINGISDNQLCHMTSSYLGKQLDQNSTQAITRPGPTLFNQNHNIQTRSVTQVIQDSHLGQESESLQNEGDIDSDANIESPNSICDHSQNSVYDRPQSESKGSAEVQVEQSTIEAGNDKTSSSEYHHDQQSSNSESLGGDSSSSTDSKNSKYQTDASSQSFPITQSDSDDSELLCDGTLQLRKNDCIDNYVMHNIIAKGKFSSIQVGRRRYSLQYVAIKKIDKDRTSQQMSSMMDVVRSLPEHRNILKHFLFSESVEYAYIVNELCVGGDLRQLLRAERRLEEQHALILARDISEGLFFVHRNSVVYADLKPSNILLDATGTLKLSDFGCAIDLKNDRDIKMLKTANSYIAWEIVFDDGVFSFNSDLYSLGIILFEFVTGAFPNQAKACLRRVTFSETPDVMNPTVVYRASGRQSSKQFVPPHEMGWQVSQGYQNLVFNLIKKDPLERLTWNEVHYHEAWRELGKQARNRARALWREMNKTQNHNSGSQQQSQFRLNHSTVTRNCNNRNRVCRSKSEGNIVGKMNEAHNNTDCNLNSMFGIEGSNLNDDRDKSEEQDFNRFQDYDLRGSQSEDDPIFAAEHGQVGLPSAGYAYLLPEQPNLEQWKRDRENGLLVRSDSEEDLDFESASVMQAQTPHGTNTSGQQDLSFNLTSQVTQSDVNQVQVTGLNHGLPRRNASEPSLLSAHNIDHTIETQTLNFRLENDVTNQNQTNTNSNTLHDNLNIKCDSLATSINQYQYDYNINQADIVTHTVDDDRTQYLVSTERAGAAASLPMTSSKTDCDNVQRDTANIVLLSQTQIENSHQDFTNEDASILSTRYHNNNWHQSQWPDPSECPDDNQCDQDLSLQYGTQLQHGQNLNETQTQESDQQQEVLTETQNYNNLNDDLIFDSSPQQQQSQSGHHHAAQTQSQAQQQFGPNSNLNGQYGMQLVQVERSHSFQCILREIIAAGPNPEGIYVDISENDDIEVFDIPEVIIKI